MSRTSRSSPSLASERGAEEERPSVSIITPTLNRAQHLRRALDSVTTQSVMPYEHIVVDGTSTDGTLEVLHNYPHVMVISEPDDGLYDAINKGIKASSGDIIGILNDDDTLLPGALEVVSKAFTEDPDAESFCGQVLVGGVDSAGDDVVIGSSRLQKLNPRAHACGSNLFNARFFRRTVFERVGLFEPDYRIAADTEFLGRCYLAEVSVTFRSIPVYRYGVHAEALTFHGGCADDSVIVERIGIANDHLGSLPPGPARRYWQRWLWWWTFHRLVRWRPRGGAAAMAKLFVRDPIGIPDFVAQFAWHLRTRKDRQGRPVSRS